MKLIFKGYKLKDDSIINFSHPSCKERGVKTEKDLQAFVREEHGPKTRMTPQYDRMK